MSVIHKEQLFGDMVKSYKYRRARLKRVTACARRENKRKQGTQPMRVPNETPYAPWTLEDKPD